MFWIRDDHYARALEHDKRSLRTQTSRKARFSGGDVKMLKEMTSEEWEEMKKEALRWQPEDF